MAAEPIRRRFTTAEYHAMAESGILGPEDRVELIEGEIWRMSPIGPLHVSRVTRLSYAFTSRLKQEEALRRTLSLNALDKVRRKFSLVDVSRRHLELYQGLLSRAVR